MKPTTVAVPIRATTPAPARSAPVILAFGSKRTRRRALVRQGEKHIPRFYKHTSSNSEHLWTSATLSLCPTARLTRLETPAKLLELRNCSEVEARASRHVTPSPLPQKTLRRKPTVALASQTLTAPARQAAVSSCARSGAVAQAGTARLAGCFHPLRQPKAGRNPGALPAG